jgi:glycosyltransferase involved in cell wall biosynthesis
VVLPYVTATQSAIVQLAFGAGKPVITTNVGGLPDVVTDNETGFLVEPRDPQALADAIAKALGDGTLVRLASNVREGADQFSWGRLVDTLQACVKPSRVGRAHLQSPPPGDGAREAPGTARTGGGH